MYLPTKIIGIVLEEEVEHCLEGINQYIKFYTRSKGYRAIEVVFAIKEASIVHATTTLKMEEWELLSMYLGMRIARLRVDRIPREIEKVWLASASLIRC